MRCLSCRALLLAVATTACARYHPPAPPAPRAAQAVSASFGRTWDAVIDVFTERNIPIRTIERASGLIAAEIATVPYEPRPGRPPQKDVKADCGHSTGPVVYRPTHVVYNVVVRGDSLSSTVRAAARWSHVPANPGGARRECSTTGVWESVVERDIKEWAELGPTRSGGRAARPTSTMPAMSAAGLPAIGPPPMAALLVPVTVHVHVVEGGGPDTPIADYDVLILSAAGDRTTLTTDADGLARTALPPGPYRIARYREARHGAHFYSWDVPFRVGPRPVIVELTARNASRRAVP